MDSAEKYQGSSGVAARLVPWIFFAAVLAVYLLTGARTYSWENQGNDGADLGAAVATGTIPHPPGFPLYLLLGKAAAATLPLPDLMWRLAVLSAIGGALAAALVYACLRQVTGSRLAAVAGAGTYAFAVLPWGQATIVEVSTWVAAFVAGAGYLLVLAASRAAPGSVGSSRRLYLSAVAVGLSVAVHPLGLTVAPLLLAVAWRLKLLPRDVRGWAKLVGAGLAPLLLYGYIYILGAQRPSLDWQDTVPLSGFIKYLSVQMYLPVLADMTWKNYAFGPVYYAMNVARNLFIFGLPLAAVGAVALWRRRFRIALLVAVTTFSIPVLVHAINPVLGGYYSVTLLPWAFLVGIGAWATIGWLDGRGLGRLRWLLLVAPLSLLVLNWRVVDVSHDFRAREMWESVLAKTPPGSLLVSLNAAANPRALDALYFGLAYGAVHGVPRPDVAVVSLGTLSHLDDISPRAILERYDWSAFKQATSSNLATRLQQFWLANHAAHPIYFISGAATGFVDQIRFGPILMDSVEGGILYEVSNISSTPSSTKP